MSIGAIAKKIRSNKSSVSYWCRDISLSEAHIRRLLRNKEEGGALGRLRAAERKRAARLQAIKKGSEQGAKEVGELSRRDLFLCGLGLYWGEGYKNGNDECGFTNSDPGMIRTYISWLKKIYKVRSEDLILRVSVNASHRKRVPLIVRFWSKATGIPRSQFTKTSLIKVSPRKRYSEPKKHFGTLRIKARRSTELRRRILGSIGEVSRRAMR